MIQFIARWYSDCRPSDFPFLTREIGWRMQSPCYAFEAAIPAKEEKEAWFYIKKDFPDFEKITCERKTLEKDISAADLLKEKKQLRKSKERITPVKKIVKVRNNLNPDKQKFREEIEKYLKDKPLLKCRCCGCVVANTPGNNFCRKCGSLETTIYFDLDAVYRAYTRLRTEKALKN